MHATPTTVRPVRFGTARPGSPRRLGLAVLAAALVSAAGCGSNSKASPETGATTSTAATTSQPTTSVPTPSTTPTTTPTTVPRPTAQIDELVGAPGRRMHIRCVGEGPTTVVLISGFGGGAVGWAKVETAVASRARVCTYERLGTGTSDPATSTQTFVTEANDLHTLLGAVGETGPYVVVGHSFGGAEAVTFASTFAHEVTGLVLIDASPTTWPAAVCAVPDSGSAATTMLRGVCDMFAPTGNSEHLDAPAAFAETAKIVSLGSLPIAVITATHRELPADLEASEVLRLNDEWNRGQQAWASLSTAAHLVPVDHTGHHIEIDQPDVVIDEITRLLP